MSKIRPLTKKEQLEYLKEFLTIQRDYYQSELNRVNHELALLNDCKKLNLEKRKNNDK